MTGFRAAQYGVTRRDLESRSWHQRYHGVHSLPERSPDDPMVRIQDAASLLVEGATLGGWAAAHLLGATDLDGIAADGRTRLPLTVCLQPQVQMCPRPGIVFLRSAFSDDETEVLSGIPILGPVRTAFDTMRRAPDITEAVVGIDALLRAGIVSIAEVEGYLAEHPGWRGCPRARRAISLADARARSCPESRFRVLWVVDASLPRPQVNVPVFATSHGALLGIPDLLDVGSALVGEYDGAFHREVERHTADNAREEDLEHHGLTVVRATSLDLTLFRRRTVLRLRKGHERGLARDRSADRWTLDLGSVR